MNESDQREKEIFNDASELTSAEAREAYLEQACAGDPGFRHRIDALFQAAAAVDGFLPDRTDVAAKTILTAPVTEGHHSVIGRYRLLEQIGEGGFGVVYMAEQQEPVRRRVALKIIKLGMDTKQVIARFEAERQALALMDHPNIAKVLDAGATETGRPFFVMELVRGIKITDYCDQNRLSTRERLELFVKVCRAIQHAHQKGIIHRDIKPSNILVTVNDGIPVPRVIDFGIAKATAQQRLTDKTLFTSFAQFIGTPAYMSPEQAVMTSVDIDTRSDIYSLGVLLYELLTGVTPFDAKELLDGGLDEMRRIIHDQDPARPSTRLRTMAEGDLTKTAGLRHSDPHQLIRSLRGDLDWILTKALEKDRNRRYETAHALAEDVERHLRHEPILARPPSILYLGGKFIRKHRARIAIGATVAVLLVGLGASLGLYRRASNQKWANERFVQAVELVRDGDRRTAYVLLQEARRHMAGHPQLEELLTRISRQYSVNTAPPGAKVWCREYTATNEPWLYLGQTPLEQRTLPQLMYRWRFEREGFAPHECVADTGVHVRLRKGGDYEDMIWIEAGTLRIPTERYAGTRPVDVPAFLIDKYEVTNEQFQRFVDGGGYRNPEHWKGLRFLSDGREISWTEALAKFRDPSGQPGPRTWQEGRYLEGQAGHPVSGVSWFEAAAYAAFAGKGLPTVYHWERAAGLLESRVIVPFSNIGMRTRSTAPVGTYRGMGRAGLCDMAGNVKEWCFNTTDDSGDRRYILGGSWDESTYVFTFKDSRSPWDRSSGNGFRCVAFPSEEPAPTDDLFDAFRLPGWRDFSNLSPFLDQEFESYKAAYRYDRTLLNSVGESVDDHSVFWLREKVSFDAAYGADRVTAHLFLPKTGAPPFQIVIFFPGVDAVTDQVFSDLLYAPFIEFIITSGRALLFPIYYGTYERPAARGRFWTFESVVQTPWAYRDWTILMSKDLGRCIDYLETRPDIDATRIGYCGHSHGSVLGPLMLAVEDRIRTSVFADGGLVPIDLPRSLDFALYAQRVTVPVLMINGREDALAPMNECQTPLYEALCVSSPLTERKHYTGGHGVIGLFDPQIRHDVLEWLDRYLGPVEH
jgi:eukaryotic-like serine/threonine-protein kinase